MTPKHYTQVAHAHYLTFSCYKRLWLFKDATLYALFLHHLDRVRSNFRFKLYGFMLMPNHVHLLIFPLPETSLSSLLSAIKGPFAHQALPHLQEHWPKVHEQLKIVKNGKLSWRFWQAGGGYDRNIFTDEVFRNTLDYLHLNPVKKELVKLPTEWKWSSARYYKSGEEDLITIDAPDWR